MLQILRYSVSLSEISLILFTGLILKGETYTTIFYEFHFFPILQIMVGWCFMLTCAECVLNLCMQVIDAEIKLTLGVLVHISRGSIEILYGITC